MGVIREYLKSAISSIRNNKGRSLLTMLGIIIGIAAVLAVLVIGDGLRAAVTGEMSALDVATINVSLDVAKTDKCFTPENMEAIERNMSCIYGLSPSVSLYGNGKGTKKSYNLSFSGGSDALSENGQNKILYGRYFTRDDVNAANYVCVISQISAMKLFGYENAVGETIEITNGDITKDFTVVGIRENTSMDESYAEGEDPSLQGDVPYTTVALAYNKDVNTMFTKVTAYMHKDNKDEAAAKMKSVVENVLGIRGESAVKVDASSGMDSTSDTILNVVTAVVALIASISLLVGGIGVMNIMTVSVTERTREIGIRKSLGARTSSILTQFLAEAAILTFLGGIIGIILGLTLARIACAMVDFPYTVNPVLVIVVVFISTGIGLFFGIYPAKRAAKLDPIEALRAE
ncbi:FtsX-like permease family protein [Butyrivibrio sp. X503]|uniref:ABC transporter permease n=1 Tax=Butyrivibrio sp. X503 TaxID=2364878 RepID=UPI000EA84A18|nr:ABC transporter permease [Butyrivibrio sp. X503]RKM58130.1 FtsX-like permease family protein [Butyrivibrio sp. X503]